MKNWQWKSWGKFFKYATVVVMGLYLLYGIFLYGMWQQNQDYLVAGVPVLNYHQVNATRKGPLTVKPEDFQWQMEYLVNHGYHSITPDELYAYLKEGKPLPAKPVLITFDDGYVDNYEEALPILAKYKLKATVFVVGKTVGTKGHLTAEQLRIMESQGFTIGSHTYTHTPLTELNHEQVKAELDQTQDVLTKILGHPTKYLAYPEGYYDAKVEKIVADSGIKLAFSIDFGKAKPGENFMQVKRIPIMEGIEIKKRFVARLNLTNYVARVLVVRSWLRDHGLGYLDNFLPFL